MNMDVFRKHMDVFRNYRSEKNSQIDSKRNNHGCMRRNLYKKIIIV